ncbi:hypothetical protein CAEBREN_30476 [Caenorhabditis brenneri]|uniref:SPK domain-containing protein n=1 Tax=Caenorhabditis brenneri TaxID=135651 RepID=G0MY38_CAEBE|nr:hypothetical protein CAEBREN_30476 [Caenorhabditis brenneri]
MAGFLSRKPNVTDNLSIWIWILRQLRLQNRTPSLKKLAQKFLMDHTHFHLTENEFEKYVTEEMVEGIHKEELSRSDILLILYKFKFIISWRVHEVLERRYKIVIHVDCYGRLKQCYEDDGSAILIFPWENRFEVTITYDSAGGITSWKLKPETTGNRVLKRKNDGMDTNEREREETGKSSITSEKI